MIRAAAAVLLLPLFISCNQNTGVLHLDNEWFYTTEENSDTWIPLDVSDFKSLQQYLPGREGIIRLKTAFSLPEEWRGELLSVYPGRITIADRTSLNGELIGRTGNFPPVWFNDWNRDRRYDIPQQLVRWDRKNELQIEMYVNYEGMINGEILIGPKDQIDRIFSYNRFIHRDISILFSFLLFFFGLYHLFIYSRRKQDKEIFWFALVTLVFSVSQTGLFISSFPGFQYSRFSNIPFMKIIGILELLEIWCFTLFTGYFFGMEKNHTARRLIFVPSLILMILFMLQGEYGLFKILLAYFELSLAIPSLYVIYLTATALRRKLSHSGIFMICLIPTGLLILHDLILPNTIEGYPILTVGIGLPLILIIINMILGLEYVRDRNEAEILNIELEQKVYKRTSELQEANEKLSFASRKESFMESCDLSKREREILDLVLDGLTNDEIAEELKISVRTVNAHLYSMYRKMGVHSRLEIFAAFRKL